MPANECSPSKGQECEGSNADHWETVGREVLTEESERIAEETRQALVQFRRDVKAGEVSPETARHLFQAVEEVDRLRAYADRLAGLDPQAGEREAETL